MTWNFKRVSTNPSTFPPGPGTLDPTLANPKRLAGARLGAHPRECLVPNPEAELYSRNILKE